MVVSFATAKMQKLCSSEAKMRKKWGKQMAQRLGQRLMELHAADTLEDISHLPPARCHELIDNRKGQISVDLVHPYRLLFKPDHSPIPRKVDGGIDKSVVTDIVILEVEDTH